MEAKCKVEWSSQRESTTKTCGFRSFCIRNNKYATQRKKRHNRKGSKNVGKTNTKHRIRDVVLKNSAQNITVCVSDVGNHKQD